MGCAANPMNELPGLTTRAKNLAGAMARWVMAGFPRVTDAVFAARLEQCANCEHLVNESHCKHPQCGCPVSRKASLATEACPIGRWSAVTGDEATPPVKPAPAPPDNLSSRAPAGTAARRTETADPATCPHVRLVATTFIDRQSRPHRLIAHVRCRECATRLMVDGKEELAVEIAHPQRK